MKTLVRRCIGCLVCGLLLSVGCSSDSGPASSLQDAAPFEDAADRRLEQDVADTSVTEVSADTANDEVSIVDGNPRPDGDGGDGDGGGGGDEPDGSTGCPVEMARIGSFCVDRYEAFVLEVREDGAEMEHSPFTPVDGLDVRAKSARGVYPQGYISQVQAARACANAGKRLCNAGEFALACRGDDPAAHYPYGATRVAGACNEGKGTPMVRLFGADATKWTYGDLNDARLNQLSDTLAPTGSQSSCVSPYGVHDCVGNLNEWGADPPDPNGHAYWRGGSYADSELNGPGCLYVTRAHEPTYHDYSTGFRCCMDAL